MVLPAMQLAGKIPDMYVQLWASALLRGKLVCHQTLNMVSNKQNFVLKIKQCIQAK